MDRHRPRRRSSISSTAGAAAFFAVAAIVMSGCFTGERPTLAQQPSTGSATVDAVIERVDSVSAAEYTAHYEVFTVFTNQTTAVSVSQAEPSRRSLTIGDIRYLVDGQRTRTCTVSTGDCVDTLDASRVSDVQLTPDFFGTSLSARLRRDVSMAMAEPTGSTEEIHGQSSTCAAIPLDGGPVTYCVFDNGVLARLDAFDVDVTMTGYTTSADETLFTPG